MICALMLGTLEMVMLPHLLPRVSVEVNGEKKKDCRTECDVLLDGRELPRMDPGETAYTMGTAIEDTEGRRAGGKQECTQQGASEHGERGSADSPSGSQSSIWPQSPWIPTTLVSSKYY